MAKVKILSVYSVSTSVQGEGSRVLIVRARGFVRSAGWREARLVLCEDPRDSPPDTLDYDFVAQRPAADGTQNIVPTKAEARIDPMPDHIRRVRVCAEIDEIVVDVGGSSEFLTADKDGAAPPSPEAVPEDGSDQPFPGSSRREDDDLLERCG